MKLYELIDILRNRLGDTIEPNLWSDEELVNYYNIIHTDLYKIFSYNLLGSINNPYNLILLLPTDLMEDIDQIYVNNPDLLNILINGICSIAYTKDESDTENLQRSLNHKELYFGGIESFKRKKLKKIPSFINIKNGFL